MQKRTYIQISSEAIAKNVSNLIDTYTGYGYYIGVVKGNVYGHGISAIGTLVSSGINYLAVSTIDEALDIRKAGFGTPILILQPISLDDLDDAIQNDLTLTVSDYEYFKQLINKNFFKQIKIHIKINSGFNRLGISDKDQLKEIFEAAKKTDNLKIEGIYSHFMTSGLNDSYFDIQVNSFKKIVSQIDLSQVPIVHLDRSLTLFSHPKIDFCTGVRMGISLFGYGRTFDYNRGFKSLIKKILHFSPKNKSLDISNKLFPAFSLFSQIIETHQIKKGARAGYGAQFVAKDNCVIAIVSFGYADGFFRKNKNGRVFINGNYFKIISVDMGMTMIACDQSVKMGDVVEFIGNHINIREVARRCDTTIYEILCAFKQSISRIFV